MADTNTFIGVMIFYIVISYLIFPLIGYYTSSDKPLDGAGHGFAIGSIISVILWYAYGKDKVNETA